MLDFFGAIIGGRSRENHCTRTRTTVASPNLLSATVLTLETHGDETIVKWMGTSTGTRADYSDHALGKGVRKRGAWERRLSYVSTRTSI